MNCSSPTFSFSIPSVHDGCKLECRLYLPGWLRNIESAPAWSVRGAIVAHPYAPLGGCFDDPVIGFVGGELLQAGYVVGTFNFRGAGNSEGRTSWTGKAELGDYVSFYGFMLWYLHRLKHELTRKLLGSAFPTQDPSAEEDRHIRLVLGGYSYGSLIASHVPTFDVMVDLFQSGSTSPSTAIYRIGRKAAKIAAATIPHLQLESPNNQADAPDLSAPTAISYLLVSPLLPPVSGLLTGFSTLSLNVGEMSTHARPVRPADQLSTHLTLALYGDQDTFTSARKLQRWSAELGRMPHSQFQGCEIEGAGHFWREEGVETRARQALQEWLRP